MSTLFLQTGILLAQAVDAVNQNPSLVPHPAFGNFLNAVPDQYSVLGLIVLLPLIGAVINGLFGSKIGRQGVYIVGVATVATSFLFSLLAFIALVKAGHANPSGGEGEAAQQAEHAATRISYVAWDWFRAPVGSATAVQIKFRYVLDALSGVMLLVVTGVGTVIHVYSTGYINHDKGFAKYFAFLNLFMFSMLNLILGDSVVLLFVGWEGVGLCSYLLIGFWFHIPEYASAGKKAFIVNRIGDVGVIVGVTILAWKVGAYDFETLRNSLSAENSGALHDLLARTDLDDFIAHWITRNPVWQDRIQAVIPEFSWGGLACFCLFVGCTGKSAQIPLYVWLPDAMAGPTPVSALIHAATMVTAGVYLLCRLSFLFVHFPSVMALIAVIGGLTALFAATIAITQTELKKVLAYSTVSQLGFMFMGCGVGAFGAGLFHVYTHAMFKACLFLGAGAVMHACRDSQDLNKLGGLRKYLPHTFRTFAVATLAIIGTPGLSGFFSKDEILFRALASHNESHPWVGKVVFALGMTTAALTAFYMCRLLFLTFWGEFKGWSLDQASYPPGATIPAHGHGDEDEHDEAHEDEHDDHHEAKPWDPPKDNPWNMTGALYVLAGLSVVAGFINLPSLFTGHHGQLALWLEPVVTEWHIDLHAAHGVEVLAMVLGTTAFLVGSGLAYYVYVLKEGQPAKAIVSAMPGVHRFVENKWKIDELYEVTVVAAVRGASAVANFLDDYLIGGIIWVVTNIPKLLGQILRQFQTGKVQVYGAILALGMLGLLGWTMWVPSVSVSYRVEGSNRMILQANGGPAYRYEWDREGDGFNGTPVFNDPAVISLMCQPQTANDGRRYCRVGVRARNAFGRVTEAVRTVEFPAEAAR